LLHKKLLNPSSLTLTLPCLMIVGWVNDEDDELAGVASD
jgi:hypothetical protein